MSRGIFTMFALVSVVLFPWPLTVLVAVAAALYVPLLPLSIGIFSDTLYYTPAAGLPLFTLGGMALTLLAFFVRNRLNTGIIKR